MDDFDERIARLQDRWITLRNEERDARKFNPAEARLPGGGHGGGQWTAGSALHNLVHAFEGQQVDAETFHKGAAQAKVGAQGPFVRLFSPEQYAKMRTYTAEGGKVGGALRDHGDGRIEIVSMFNNGGSRGAGTRMLDKLTGEQHQTPHETRQMLRLQFHPVQLKAEKQPHPHAGDMKKVGIERKPTRPTQRIPFNEGQEGPATLDVIDHGTVFDNITTDFPKRKGVVPITEVYRSVSAGEWAQAQKRGYLGGSSTLEAAAHPDDALPNLPNNAKGSRVLKIAVKPGTSTWFNVGDSNTIRTREAIPISDVIDVSVPINTSKNGATSVAGGNYAEVSGDAMRTLYRGKGFRVTAQYKFSDEIDDPLGPPPHRHAKYGKPDRYVMQRNSTDAPSREWWIEANMPSETPSTNKYAEWPEPAGTLVTS